MAKNTRRINRMGRAARRAKRTPGMNLVSLMDIFTILVFFLLVNSANTQNLPSPEQVKLPESVSQKQPEETTVVMVTNTDILVQGKVVASRDEVAASRGVLIAPLRDELLTVSSRALGISSKSRAAHKEVTIMGDREIPFRLLKKIMTSCTAAGFETINLAVIQKASQTKKKETS
jgi:biopolymer transport protein TolR